MAKSIALSLLACTATGCINTRKPATQPVTAVDPKTATAEYWLDKPATTRVRSDDFAAMWSAAEQTLRGHYFTIDRADQRLALMTTRPLVSKQIFEVWRNDIQSGYDQLQSSLATIRRTVRFEIERTPEGTYVLTPKVLVERFNAEEHRVTAAVNYMEIYGRPAPEEERRSEGKNWPSLYWYAIGRDTALERTLAASIRERVAPE